MKEVNTPETNNRKTLKKHLLNIQPIPLMHNKLRLMVLWTHKSGCTYLNRWFFDQIGHLKAAQDYYNVHYYRDEVYFKSNLHEHSVEAFQKYDFDVVKIVRNPYKRAVSSYIQFLGMVDRKNPVANEFYGGQIPKQGITFNEFLSKLKTKDIKTCNMHWRVQTHQIERIDLVKVNHLVKLEESRLGMAKVERRLNLKHTRPHKLRKSSHHTVANKESDDIAKCVGTVSYTHLTLPTKA